MEQLTKCFHIRFLMQVVDILTLFKAYLLRIKLTAHLFKVAKVLNTVFSCFKIFFPEEQQTLVS